MEWIKTEKTERENMQPAIKRGHRVVKRENFLFKAMVSFIKAFGFEYREAPAEAEAELARMNKLGIVDAIITDDSNIFLYGAKTVIRNWNVKSHGDAVRVFESSKFQLSRECLILDGLMMGGDYDQKGLRGCGSGVALATAKRFGSQLCDASTQLSQQEFQSVFLPEWRAKFPDPSILTLYVAPIVTSDKDLAAAHSKLTICMPNVQEITHLCELYFVWATRSSRMAKFETLVFPGLIVAILREEARRHTAGSRMDLPQALPISSTLFPIGAVLVGTQSRRVHNVQHRNILCSISYLRRLVQTSFTGAREPVSSIDTPITVFNPLKLFSLSVPESLLRAIHINHPLLHPYPAESFEITAPSLGWAFISSTVNASTLALLIASQEPTAEQLAEVSNVLEATIATADSGIQGTLAQHYRLVSLRLSQLYPATQRNASTQDRVLLLQQHLNFEAHSRRDDKSGGSDVTELTRVLQCHTFDIDL
ncbi:hypothetical protein HWV62_5423 [Athelia sp. TMB]|nr:hypothetical protein HWV62_5423 [Athelia sp. TMB]